MPKLNTTPLDRQPASWLPSFDLHEQDGELVLHADIRGFDDEDVQVSLDGSDLIVQAEEGECYGCYHLPFPSQTLHLANRTGHDDLEVHILMPPRREQP
jgi:hypothetical protein